MVDGRYESSDVVVEEVAGEPIASSNVRWSEGLPSCLPGVRAAVRVERRGGGCDECRLAGLG